MCWVYNGDYKDECVMKTGKPRKGQQVIATKENPDYDEGYVLGVVSRVDGNICHMTNDNSFIWRFSDCLNKFHSWESKEYING